VGQKVDLGRQRPPNKLVHKIAISLLGSAAKKVKRKPLSIDPTKEGIESRKNEVPVTERHKGMTLNKIVIKMRPEIVQSLASL
jgi:hypothetical protein